MRKMDCQMYCCERVAVEAALRRTKPRSAARLVIDDGRSHADMAHPYLRAFGTPIMNIPDGCWKTAAAVSILNACELMIMVSASGYSKGNTEMAPDELRNSFQTFFQQATGKSTPGATSASDNLFQTITNDGTGIDNSRLQSTSLFDNLVSLHLLPFQAGESQLDADGPQPWEFGRASRAVDEALMFDLAPTHGCDWTGDPSTGYCGSVAFTD